ncbi:MAG: hypothetical protein CFE24_11860 [Flavobacterium sp. BFFFF2]|nr:MAG: hypothetical protein CFE24_11860 [Flavobacterium sp. BFFFF2]
MKKKFVLFVLFILPLVAYLFFATGANHFIVLPTVTPNIPELKTSWKTQDAMPARLSGKITILSFVGDDLWNHRGNFFTLHQKIYKPYQSFKDFQFVWIAPIGSEVQVSKLLQALNALSDNHRYRAVFASQSDIDQYYESLHLVGSLDEHHGSPLVFIVDKKCNLRGRKGKSKKGEIEYKEGYNTQSAAELHNDMTDDVKIILAEYRSALKKNNAQRKV